MSQVPTLYEWVGGAERIEELFRVFYEKVRKDEGAGTDRCWCCE
jgi:truncated hemoglobin YjbI